MINVPTASHFVRCTALLAESEWSPDRGTRTRKIEGRWAYNKNSEKTMKNTKFLVKVSPRGTRAPEYVQRIDRTPIQTTTNRKLALIMGRFTAEDAVKSIQTSRCSPGLVSIQVRV